jgi:hypothetical protein
MNLPLMFIPLILATESTFAPLTTRNPALVVVLGDVLGPVMAAEIRDARNQGATVLISANVAFVVQTAVSEAVPDAGN